MSSAVTVVLPPTRKIEPNSDEAVKRRLIEDKLRRRKRRNSWAWPL